MPTAPRRFALLSLLAALVILAFYDLVSWERTPPVPFGSTTHDLRQLLSQEHDSTSLKSVWPPPPDIHFRWDLRPQNFPVDNVIPLPKGNPVSIPRIQHEFNTHEEPSEEKQIRLSRLKAVRDAFQHTWDGYTKHAWMASELMPISGGNKSSFGGWGATLVDSLDSLWIMGFETQFHDAVKEVAKIDFTTSGVKVISMFETTIRYLGGLLSAYDLSGEKVLLQKAVELGEMLYCGFDTPNRMPVSWYDLSMSALGQQMTASPRIGSAEIGSLTLEFARLAQLTGQDKYFDVVQRVTKKFMETQNHTKLPGMWPVIIDPSKGDFVQDRSFSLGAMADSLYEYFPKTYLLLGGRSLEYRHLYESSIDVAKKQLFFRPMTPDNRNVLISGEARMSGMSGSHFNLTPKGQHLTCFVGGMVGLGSQVFSRPSDLDIAAKLTDGCVWAYESMPSGVGPEMYTTLQCPDEACAWEESTWLRAVNHTFRGETSTDTNVTEFAKQKALPLGFVDVPDRRYILRPEAIESVFIMYRITGDKSWQDKAWKMFEAVSRTTKTEIAHAALKDVTSQTPKQSDSMESFWTAETLKYYYLIFAEPGVISLDEWVLNTEAHPLRRPTRKRWSW